MAGTQIFTPGDLSKTVFGNLRVHIIKFTITGGTTTMEIDSGFKTVAFAAASIKGAAGTLLGHTIDEDFPLVGAAGANAMLTINANANDVGHIIVFGR